MIVRKSFFTQKKKMSSDEIEEGVFIDEYSKYCFDVIKSVDEKYLEKIGFVTEKDIRDLFSEKIFVQKKREKKCKFCKSFTIIERSIQIRSMDEGETLIHYCSNCKKTF
jgi:DNA-directed RNA polymerase subunit M/transcription elongation factor TFIIS